MDSFGSDVNLLLTYLLNLFTFIFKQRRFKNEIFFYYSSSTIVKISIGKKSLEVRLSPIKVLRNLLNPFVELTLC